MLASQAAFWCLVFGYFFFWSQHPTFPPAGVTGPGVLWPTLGGLGVAAAWVAIVSARRCNGSDNRVGFYLSIVLCLVLAALGAAGLVAGPLTTNLDPTAHAYQATVWILVAWNLLHLIAGSIMVVYSLLRRAAGRLTARHDIDISNTVLFWHFTLFTAAITVAVIAGFPLVA
jgi:cytochrome c oxidase subunit I+III